MRTIFSWAFDIKCSFLSLKRRKIKEIVCFRHPNRSLSSNKIKILLNTSLHEAIQGFKSLFYDSVWEQLVSSEDLLRRGPVSRNAPVTLFGS